MIEIIHYTCNRCGEHMAKSGVKYLPGMRYPHCSSNACPWCMVCAKEKGIAK